MSGGKLYPLGSVPEIRRRIAPDQTRIGVYGLGPTGLAVGVIAASKTKNVIGVEPDTVTAKQLATGECWDRRDEKLADVVEKAVDAGAFRISTNAVRVAAHADVHVVTAPTGVRSDGAPDLSQLRTILRDVGSGLSRGDLVVLGSMQPPKTTRDVVLPVLRDESRLDADEFGVGICGFGPDR
ncbi:MAG: nucleotide sugar dehydrogenase, partial [Halobacteriota archaeon]